MENKYEDRVRVREHIDIICDGQSQKEKNGYDEVFGFQVLGGRPFYFYKTNGTYGINYDEVEHQLRYDEITWNSPHPAHDLFVFHFENMVIFGGTKGEDSYQIVIGPFE